ncbi:basic proline-rich protein-like isoform X1 [Grus americana]|uniref:basic proline-rich protein-like isoform X1 n=1 Tax=Grus americana TaxID=9117 RepID=UPI00240889DB|nr:basic proline-rich protein-like isoform X1 [Grus americana]
MAPPGEPQSHCRGPPTVSPGSPLSPPSCLGIPHPQRPPHPPPSCPCPISPEWGAGRGAPPFPKPLHTVGCRGLPGHNHPPSLQVGAPTCILAPLRGLQHPQRAAPSPLIPGLREPESSPTAAFHGQAEPGSSRPKHRQCVGRLQGSLKTPEHPHHGRVQTPRGAPDSHRKVPRGRAGRLCGRCHHLPPGRRQSAAAGEPGSLTLLTPSARRGLWSRKSSGPPPPLLPAQVQGEAKLVGKGPAAQYKGVFGTIATTVRTEGPRSLYSGLAAGLQRQMSFASIRSGLYDSAKQFYAKGSERAGLGSWQGPWRWPSPSPRRW